MKSFKSNKKSASSSSDTIVKSERNSKLQISTGLPSEEDIRLKALEIYFQRVERGEERTAEEDWYEAEEYLKS